MITIINKYRKFFLKIYNFIPAGIRPKIKILYRKYILNSIYSRVGNNIDRQVVYKNGKYQISRLNNSTLKNGVNLIGFHSQESGLAQQAKNTAKALEAAGISFSLFDCSYVRIGSGIKPDSLDKLVYNTNIFVCNGDAIARLAVDYKEEIFKGRYNILYGAWELSKYPSEWLSINSYFDEYWAMSSFLQKSVSDSSVIPVLHMPYPVEVEAPQKYSRSDFNLPKDKFLYIFTFDLSSVANRKNPKGVIKAFYEAFPVEQNVGLVIKSVSKKEIREHQIEIEALEKLKSEDNRIYLIDEELSRDKMLDLLNACDVYVSLHRAEGLGIGMAESMIMHKPVIATNYSGNTDFTHHDNSCLVGYNLINLKPLDYIYEEDKVWADPNISQAAAWMNKLYNDKEYRQNISAKAAEYIRANYNAEKCGKKYLERLQLLGLIK